jgi:hypothetical protein
MIIKLTQNLTIYAHHNSCNTVFPRDMVCLRNISVDTLHKGGPGVASWLRHCAEGTGIDPRSLGIFSGASDSSMCPGVDSASKNEYQDIPGVKDGRCLRLATLPPTYAECLEILEP